jgi:hypothetical protein
VAKLSDDGQGKARPLSDRGFNNGRRVSPLLLVRSKLFEREQVDHSPVFNASLAQSHNVLSHKRHQFMIRVKTKRLARVRERRAARRRRYAPMKVRTFFVVVLARQTADGGSMRQIPDRAAATLR